MIFPSETIDRSVMRWEDYIYSLTPFEKHQGIWWKRDDYFAPLGYGGPNGSKLRQLLHLIDNYVKTGANKGVITGASILSPQLSMSSLVAKHYELPMVIVLGGTKPETSIKAENVYISAEAGAQFFYTPVAYNPAIQHNVKKIQAEHYSDYYKVCYGITTPEDSSPAGITAFHEVGAYQVKNLPAHIKTLAVPMGSANSCVSVLYGIAKYRPAALEKVVLFGIGPTRLDHIEYRLRKIEEETGLEILDLFKRKYHHNRDEENDYQTGGQILIEHFNLHATKYASYTDKMPYRLKDGSISFHPTYEGKCLSYMDSNPGYFDWYHNPDGTAAFWIVGSEPSRKVLEGKL